MQSKQKVEVDEETWGTTLDGDRVRLFCLRNDRLEISLSDYGARLVSAKVPDRSGHREHVVLGFDTLEDYRTDTSYMGATVGRFANRIAGGSFDLDGESYAIKLAPGARHALHGGAEGFDRRIWKAQIVPMGVRMQLTSLDGDMGFPGRVDVEVCYRLHENQLSIKFEATTDNATLLNLTNHAYFNLKGTDSGDILSHQVKIVASAFTPIDAEAIPTGEIRDVSGTPFDLREPQRIGDRIADPDLQMQLGDGFNHNFVLDSARSITGTAAEVFEPVSGRVLSVSTSQPGMQFYTGNALEGREGRDGSTYRRHAGFCLETQHFPDSPHHPEFPSTVLRPGERFSSLTIYGFSHR